MNTQNQYGSASRQRWLYFLLMLPAISLADFPDQSTGAAFKQDLRFVSAVATLPITQLGSGNSQLVYGPVFSKTSTGPAVVQVLEYTLQPGDDFSLRAGLERWPGERPILGTSLSLMTFRQSEGKLDYSLGITWHKVQSAGVFNQRDVAIQGGFLRGGDRWQLQIGVGPVLRHSFTANTDHIFKDGVEWLGHAHFNLKLTKSFDISLSTPLSSDGLGVKMGLAWRLKHGPDLGTKTEEERK